MIEEKLYKDCVTSIVNLLTVCQDLYSATNGSIELLEIREISKIIDCMQDIIKFETNDYVEECGSNLEYFLYDCQCGKDSDIYTITETVDGVETEYKLTDVNALWDYINSNKEITNEQHIKSLNTEDFAQYIRSVYVAGRLMESIGKSGNVEEQDYVKWLGEKHDS